MTQNHSPTNARSVFASVTTLYFMWGFITCMNDHESDETSTGVTAGH